MPFAGKSMKQIRGLGAEARIESMDAAGLASGTIKGRYVDVQPMLKAGVQVTVIGFDTKDQRTQTTCPAATDRELARRPAGGVRGRNIWPGPRRRVRLAQNCLRHQPRLRTVLARALYLARHGEATAVCG